MSVFGGWTLGTVTSHSLLMTTVSWVSRCVGWYHGCQGVLCGIMGVKVCWAVSWVCQETSPPLSVSAQFVPGTHLLFSCGKDHTVKCWDADTFDHIMTLEVGCVIL